MVEKDPLFTLIWGSFFSITEAQSHVTPERVKRSLLIVFLKQKLHVSKKKKKKKKKKKITKMSRAAVRAEFEVDFLSIYHEEARKHADRLNTNDERRGGSTN